MATHKLTARSVAALKAPGRYSDGEGLYLLISPGRRRWVLRFVMQGKVREMGLGAANKIGLAEVRALASAARRDVAAGRDPIAGRTAAHEADRRRKTFGECADNLLNAKSDEWRNDKHRAQWRMTLERYAEPLRSMPVDEVDTAGVLAALKPLWQATPETASRLRGRIEAVLDFARAHGHREGENPARWRGHLDKLLPKRQKLARGHHAAMPYAEVAGFLARLRERESIAAMALEFAILTAGRSGEVLGARWDEIDLDGGVWVIPAARMKAGREHRVPLSGRAQAILRKLADIRNGDFVFPGRQAAKPLSQSAMEMVLQRMKVKGVTVHGFRSAFRDWCGEETGFPREIAEAALAHVAGDATERAYRRGDALEKRRTLMDAWAAYCELDAGSNVIPLRA